MLSQHFFQCHQSPPAHVKSCTTYWRERTLWRFAGTSCFTFAKIFLLVALSDSNLNYAPICSSVKNASSLSSADCLMHTCIVKNLSNWLDAVPAVPNKYTRNLILDRQHHYSKMTVNILDGRRCFMFYCLQLVVNQFSERALCMSHFQFLLYYHCCMFSSRGVLVCVIVSLV